MITAHGGALGTGRNSKLYFDTMKSIKPDAIEVDIMMRGDVLYLAHVLPPISLKRAIKLDSVFEYCKENNFRVNCDVKRKYLAKAILSLAKKIGVTNLIYFTGEFCKEEVSDLTDGEAFVNTNFYSSKFALNVENLVSIKAYIDSFKNKLIRGINIKYQYATDEFLAKAREIGLNLSIYTVDDIEVLKRLISEKPSNITTNLIDKANEMRAESTKVDF